MKKIHIKSTKSAKRTEKKINNSIRNNREILRAQIMPQLWQLLNIPFIVNKPKEITDGNINNLQEKE